MISEIVAALLETPRSRQIFRAAAISLCILLGAGIISLLFIGWERARVGAPIEIWVFKIGPVPADAKVDTGPSATREDIDVRNTTFRWRTPAHVWTTDAECESDLRQAIGQLQLSNLARSGDVIYGHSRKSMVAAACYGQEETIPYTVSVFAYGPDVNDVDASISSFLSLIPE